MIKKENNPKNTVAVHSSDTSGIGLIFGAGGALYQDYHRWILWFPVMLATGVGLYFSLYFEPSWWLGISSFLVLLVTSWLFRKGHMLFLVLVALCTVSLGFTAAQYRTMDLATITLQRSIGPVDVSGRVVAVEIMPTGSRIVLENLTIDGDIKAYEVPQKVRIRINSSKGEVLHPGDWVQVYAVLRPPSPPASPHAFDFQRYAYFKGMGAYGFSYSTPVIVKKAEQSTTNHSFKILQSRLRQFVSTRIRNALPGETGMVATALITGEKKGISGDTFDAMRDAGLAHLLAISGLHIGLIAGLVFYVVRAGLALIPAIAVRYPIKTWAALTALAAALGYTILAGSTIPTLRAFTMMALVLGAIMIGRRGITLRLVGFAAVVILLFQPESLLSASFQLSFAAVTGLVACYEEISQRYYRSTRDRHIMVQFLYYFGGIVLTTLIAGVATAPFVAYHFHQIASYGNISNLAAIPLTALWIMPSALVAMILMPLGLESIAFTVMGWGIEALVFSAKSVADLPGNVQITPAFSTFSLVVMVVGALWLCLWQSKIRMIGAGVATLGLVLAVTTPQPLLLAGNNARVFAIQDSLAITVLGPGANANRFVRNIWAERAGFSKDQKLGKSKTPLKQSIQCDTLGCLYHKNGLTIALVWQEAALSEDCWIADVIISRVPVRKHCPKPHQIIDRYDLWKNGAHALYLDGKKVTIINTTDVRGVRPWTITPKPRGNNSPSSGLSS